MFKLLSLKPDAFGLDISDLSLKIVKLEKRGKYFDLASFGEVKMKPGIIRKGKIKKEEVLIKIIKDALKKIRGKTMKTKYVVASLPEGKSFLQVIQMPKMDKEDLKSAVIYEAENYIPLAIENVYLDSQVVPPLYNHLDHLDILIAALPKETVDPYVSCLKKAGLRIKALEIESLSIARALIKDEVTPFPILLIDLGATRTGFIIFSGHSLRFTSSIPVSSQNFTEIISKTLNLNLLQAEKLKLRHGLKDKKVFDALIPPLTDLTEQVRKYLDYYQSHASHEHLPPNGKGVRKIFLCGGGAQLKGLVAFLSSQLKIPVEIGNPWINILRPASPPGKQTSIFGGKPLGYVTALGLALRGIKGI